MARSPLQVGRAARPRAGAPRAGMDTRCGSRSVSSSLTAAAHVPRPVNAPTAPGTSAAGRGESVADARDRDQAPGVSGAEFAPQPVDMDVDGAGAGAALLRWGNRSARTHRLARWPGMRPAECAHGSCPVLSPCPGSGLTNGAQQRTCGRRRPGKRRRCHVGAAGHRAGVFDGLRRTRPPGWCRRASA